MKPDRAPAAAAVVGFGSTRRLDRLIATPSRTNAANKKSKFSDGSTVHTRAAASVPRILPATAKPSPWKSMASRSRSAISRVSAILEAIRGPGTRGG
jgi:hypothetical protein